MSKVHNINDLYHEMSLLLKQDIYDQLIDSQTLLLSYEHGVVYSEHNKLRLFYPETFLLNHCYL